MQRWLKYLVLALSLVCLGATPSLAQTAKADKAAKPSYTDALLLIDVWLDAQRDYEKLVGLSAGVVVGQNLVWSGAYGNLDAAGKAPAQADTLYSICSISKTFTAVAIMQLVEAGKLRLDDDIGDLLPEFKVQRTDADSGPITIRALLTHASGLPGEAGYAGFQGPDWRFPSKAELKAKLKEVRTLYAANTYNRYSNLGLALLGLVVEQLSGMTYADYLQQQIFTPLQLTDTRVGLPTDLLGTRLAVAYGPIKRDGTRERFAPFDTAAYAGAAGITSTVPDLGRFAAWQFRLLKSGGSELLRVASLREMQRVQWMDSDGKKTWGLGFVVVPNNGNKLVSHTGSCPGYLTALVMQPKDEVAVIAMTNNQVTIGDYTRGMRTILDKGRNLAERSDKDKLDLAVYAGLYDRRNRGGEQAIVPWGNGLAILDLPSPDPAAGLDVYKHKGDDVFQTLREDGSVKDEIRFLRDAAGRVTGYLEDSHTSSRLGDLPTKPRSATNPR